MKQYNQRDHVFLYLSLLCVFFFVSCWGTDDSKKGDAEKNTQNQGEEHAQAAPNPEDLMKRLKEVEAENEQLKEKSERDRFRVQEMEKQTDQLKALQNLNKDLSDQVEALNIQLKEKQTEPQKVEQEKSPDASSLYEIGSCVRWYGGLYEGKKIMRGKVVLINGDKYLVTCTDTEAPYLYAVGEHYEFSESELSSCGEQKN
jgi:hypothetical protein